MAEAEATTPPPVPAEPSADPGLRGTTTIAAPVVEKIARAAALGVAGVAPVSMTTTQVSGVLGRDLPRAVARLAGHRATVALEIGSLWPYPVRTVAVGVREAVTARLRQLAAVEADEVSVSITRVVRAGAPRRARVR